MLYKETLNAAVKCQTIPIKRPSMTLLGKALNLGELYGIVYFTF
jgi:hypothetical protein